MSPLRLTIKIKQTLPINDTNATCTTEAPTGCSTTIQQPITDMRLAQEHSAPFSEVCQNLSKDAAHPPILQGHADITTLKLLQNLELQAWIADNKLPAPKSKRKDGTSFFCSCRVILSLCRPHCNHSQQHWFRTAFKVGRQ